MLKFNTHRALRYLRSRFIEGKFLLASEAIDIQLENMDLLKEVVRKSLGDVAIGDAWKVEYLSDTEVLIKPGDAWKDGIPFVLESETDHLVSGDSLTLGIAPIGVSVTDTDGGKKLTLTKTSTPTDNYRIVITAREELITDTEDAFIKNANLTETTAQKLRLFYKINVVSESAQTETPIPYTNDTTDENLVNKIVVSPTAAGNGELISTAVITTGQAIDGRDLELTIRNDAGLGGGKPIPDSITDQETFQDGILIDSNGAEYHINSIFNDVVSTQVIIRIDKEVGQPNPVLTNGETYTLVKRNVHAQEGVNGTPQGKLFFPIATLGWDITDGVKHSSDITDLRSRVLSQSEFQDKVASKFDLILTEGGNVNYDNSTSTVTWSADFKLVNPHGVEQTISAGSAALPDGASLVYEMDLDGGGAIEKGTLAVTASSSGSSVSLSGSPDLSSVKIGNTFEVGGEVVSITDIDNVNDTLTVSPATTVTGAATIYLDTFAAGTASQDLNNFALAVRKGSKVYFSGGSLELEDGETGQVGDGGMSVDNLTYIGATGESDSTPNYSSTNSVTQGTDLTSAIGELDADLGNYFDLVRVTARSPAEVTVDVTDAEQALAGGETLIFPLTSKVSDYGGGTINFETGTITGGGASFTGASSLLSNSEEVFYSVALQQDSPDILIVTPGTPASIGSAAYAPFPGGGSVPRAQVLVEKDGGGIVQVVDAARIYLATGAGVGDGTGAFKSDFIDPISSSLPTGTSVTIDGISGVDGDLVLFTNLSSGNNRVYELSGVGVSLVWTAVRAFNGLFDPADGDTVRVIRGDAFQDQLAVFDGTDWKVNDTIRLFDGADFWELGSIKTSTLTDNTTASVFEVGVAGSENFIINYSITRGSAKETGSIYLTSDGTNAAVSRSNSYIGDVGVEFTADVLSGDLRLRYTTTSTGSNATMKYFTSRWSNTAGGPTGIPNYTAFTGTLASAAGSPDEVQFHGSGGLLDADTDFKWDSTNDAINLNGLEIVRLNGPVTINDNQVVAADLASYTAASYPYVIMEYSIERNGDRRVGRMLVPNDGTGVAFSDDFVHTADTGVTLSAAIVGSDVKIQYTSTSTGFSGSFKYTLRRWS